MTAEPRMDPIEAARAFVDKHFPDCLAVIVAGSFRRGEDTPTSDLDLVIVTTREESPFRASYRAHGWPVEAFVHTHRSYRQFFAADVARRQASLPAMCAEGAIVRDRDGAAARMQEEAREVLRQGPPPLTPEEIEDLRYGITDALDDFLGCDRPEEGIFVAAQLAEKTADLILLRHRQWLGRGKWLLRALRRHDPTLAGRLAAALQEYARHGDKGGLVAFVDEALAPAGGRLFEGYYRAGPRDEGERT